VAGEIDRFTIEKRALFEDRLVWLQINVSTLPEQGRRPNHGIVQVQDVTERKRFEEQLRYIADHDSLTGLVNRRRFREEFETQLALQGRYGGEGALLLVDVDRLKAINDSRGHGAGDLVLRRVAEVLRSRMRSTDVVARLAGDEFAVLLPSVAAEQAVVLGEELIARLADEEIEGWNISISVGVAPFAAEPGQEPGTAEDVTAAADAAMYRAKQRGGGVAERAKQRGHIVGRSPEAPDRQAAPADGLVGQAGTLTDRVRSELEGERLLLYGQPAVDLQSGDVAHRELLVRMRDESGSVLAASEFLAAAAQEPGLCAEIDRWVVDHAMDLLENGYRGSRLQVNLSGETIADGEARERLTATLKASPANAGLALEVGEGSIRRDVEQATEALTGLAATGSPVVLDGFTAGFGSFEYLQQLPLDQVKIDGSVTRALVADEPDHATMRAIVHLAHGTGKATVAKLVESEAVVPILRMHGVDMAQGYELGAPEPIAD
jgi:diguanylate cyclase (GGDEF)-like protein